MENTALLFIVESVLGKGQATSKGNYAFKCPFCTHHKPKLEINLRTTSKRENFWHCWICGAKGKSLLNLFKKVKAPADKINELNILIIPDKKEDRIPLDVLELPREFISLSNAIEDKGNPIWWYVIILKVSMRIWFISLMPALIFALIRLFKRDYKAAPFLFWFTLILD
jgi:hypothetical protein